MMKPREQDPKNRAESSLFDILVETNEANRSKESDGSLLGVLRRVRRENDAKRKRAVTAKRLAKAT
jgi:hypothetical protein